MLPTLAEFLKKYYEETKKKIPSVSEEEVLLFLSGQIMKSRLFLIHFDDGSGLPDDIMFLRDLKEEIDYRLADRISSLTFWTL